MSQLPQGWAEAKLEDVCLVFESRDPGWNPDAEFTYVDIGAIDNKTQSIASPKRMLGAEAPSRARRVIKANDVLFSTVRTYLKNVAMVPPDLDSAYTSTGIAVLRAGYGIEPRYLFNWVTSDEFITEISKSQDGTLYPAVTDKDVFEAGIRLAPVPEQRRIVAKVDGLTARTARARKELDRIPTLIARYKQRLLTLAFSGELTAGWRAQNEDVQPVAGRSAREIRSKFATGENDEFDPPFDIPPTWLWLRLPEIGDLDRGKSRHRPRNDPKLFGGPYPFVQTGDVRAADRVLTDFETTYSEFGLEQSRLWPIGTVCITIAANIAETAILGIEACFPDSVVGFLPDADKVSGAFVEFFIRTMRSELEAFAPATAQKNINLNVLSSVRVPVPPAEEQAEIVRRIESAFGWLDRMAADHAAATRLLPKLDAAILAKAFRGKLVPQDPNDEPASVLLERIRAEPEELPKPKRGRSRTQVIRPAIVESGTEVFPPTIEVTKPVRPRKSAMTKSRHDDDVWQKPYLAGLLKLASRSDVQTLFRAADLPVADFYKQLAWEIEHKHIVDSVDKLKAA